MLTDEQVDALTEADIAKGEALLAAMDKAHQEFFDAGIGDATALMEYEAAEYRFDEWTERHGRSLLQSAREVQRLREALRKWAISNDNGYGHCAVCDLGWHIVDGEQHEPGCLAALTPDGGRNDQ